MTALEQQTFRDGFRVCLLCVNAERRRNAMAFHAALFDGGKEVDARTYEASFFADPDVYLDLRRFLARVASAPHVLVTHGRGSRQLVEDCLSDHLPEFRVLDLTITAKVLLPNAPDTRESDHAVDVGSATDLLWAVVAEAGQKGFDWQKLLAAAATPEVAFYHYTFNEITLLTVPEAPGAYLMRDAEGNALYVGKAANLNRRLQDYFRRSRKLPAKLRTLRDRIHDFEVLPVGSELEALLLENRLIDQYRPEVNVQRVVAEGRSQYAAPLLPVVLFEPSSHANRVELFWFAPHRSAVQLRFNPQRPARKTLTQLLDYIHAQRRSPPKAPTVTNWGPVGTELCVRYFGSHRARLQWIELASNQTGTALAERMATTAGVVMSSPPEAIEFRE